jgi:pSer/pThr/pTyr-binding forkhead associated (FHA) protein
VPDLVLDLLKYAFLAILYVFIARAVRAVYVELNPPPVSSRSVPAKAPARRGKKAPAKAVVVEGSANRKSFDLSSEVMIGRGDNCHVVLKDSYVSQAHARIFTRNGSVMLEDLGSTNGTYLNRRKVTAPVELQRGDKVKIGKTVLEMRK